jgi:hypothetical protein
MSVTVRLKYDQCPTCGMDALIEITAPVGEHDASVRDRITRLECSNEDCLHYFAVLQPF